MRFVNVTVQSPVVPEEMVAVQLNDSMLGCVWSPFSRIVAVACLPSYDAVITAAWSVVTRPAVALNVPTKLFAGMFTCEGRVRFALFTEREITVSDVGECAQSDSA